MFKNKSFYLWVLFMPILFLIIFSRIGGGDSKVKVIFIDKVKNEITKEFKERLKRDFKIIIAMKQLKEYTLIELSGDFLLKNKENTKVKVIFPENISKEREVYTKIAVYRIMAELVAKYKLGIKDVKEFVRIKKQCEKLLEIPWGIRHTLPAIILMFILFNVLSKGVEKFFQFKEQGLIERFSVLPQGTNGVLIFFLLYQVTLAMVAVSVIFILGVLFFKFSIGLKYLIYLYFIFLFFSIFVASLSLLIFSLIKKKEAAIGFGVLIANILCALGGLWWPIEIVPPFFKKLGLALPTGFTMKIIDGLIYYKMPVKELMPMVFVLIAISVLFFLAATFFFFKFQEKD
ncbi:ABC transporter permease [Thermotomaculum hydrothermale]|nr:ABC transporter permease [Thermotomaculum hydrothermale]